MERASAAAADQWIGELLAEYDLTPQKIASTQGRIEVETARGNFWLIPLGEAGEGLAEMWDRLSRGGFQWLPRLMRNKYGDRWAKIPTGVWVVAGEVEGREGNYKRSSFRRGMGRFLARFHERTEEWEKDGPYAPDDHRWRQKWAYRLQEMNRLIGQLEKQEYRSSFDDEVLEWSEPFLEMGRRAVHLLQALGEEIDGKCQPALHNLRASRFLRGRGNQVYLPSLNGLTWEPPMADLGRACLEAMKSNRWRPESAMQLITAYGEYLPLDRRDGGILLAFLLFPHDFWRLMDRAYRQHGRWDYRRAERIFRQAVDTFPKKIVALAQLATWLGRPELLEDSGDWGVPEEKPAAEELPEVGESRGMAVASAPVPAPEPKKISLAACDRLVGEGCWSIPEEKPLGRYLPTWFVKERASFDGQWGERIIPWARKGGVALWPSVELRDLEGELLPPVWLSEAAGHQKAGWIAGINVDIGKLAYPGAAARSKLARFLGRLKGSGMALSLRMASPWLTPEWTGAVEGLVDRYYVAAGPGKVAEEVVEKCRGLIPARRVYPVVALTERPEETQGAAELDHLLKELGLGGAAVAPQGHGVGTLTGAAG